MLSRFLCAFVGVVASVTAPSSFSADLPTVSPSSHTADRKEISTAESAQGELPVLATLHDIHTGDALILDDESPSMPRFSEMLEDRVTGSRIDFDPKLVELLRRLARQKQSPRIELVSGYRSPKLNEMLRKKEHHVASHSQHSLGHAVDFRIEGVTPKELRKSVEALSWKGGIGQYDGATDRFVHCDVGPDRRWHER